MKANYLLLAMPVVALLMNACRKDVTEKQPSSLNGKVAVVERAAAPSWLVSKVTYTDLIIGDTHESVYSYNTWNKPVYRIRTIRSGGKVAVDTTFFFYNSSQQLIKFSPSEVKWGDTAYLRYDARGRLSQIRSGGGLHDIDYTYPNDSTAVGTFGTVRDIFSHRDSRTVYFFYDGKGNLRQARLFQRDGDPITDTTGLKPWLVYISGPYDDHPSADLSLNIPGPWMLAALSDDSYFFHWEYSPRFSANNPLLYTNYRNFQYTYKPYGLPDVATEILSGRPEHTYKFEYIPAR
ncbi:MAG TPA: hypothetical protein VM802_23110 [Chitinophaga sp.]|uniref:hypothetical protein n=1 Tax=Chitinophaga sp. TaxID=1869181 RepID=UPI002C39CF36|nr:hypothetical protein [Chitinophaga sp.]HVI47780.1 hypothetical protein [Chitinophaga sp.]